MKITETQLWKHMQRAIAAGQVEAHVSIDEWNDFVKTLVAISKSNKAKEGAKTDDADAL